MISLKLTINKSTQELNFQYETASKFSGDNFVYENKYFLLYSGGVNLIFNSISEEENAQLCWSLYNEKGDVFFDDFRGSFCGILFDKLNDKWVIYNNHIGDQKLFYTETENELYVFSDIFELAGELKNSNIECLIDYNAAYQLLSYGYMTDNSTLLSNTKRLIAGQFLTLEKNKVEVKSYYKLDNTPNNDLTEDECIEKIDILFDQAIKRQFDKDKLYNLRHLASMSGGLDCRMTNYAANKLDYSNITNITFSQYSYLDMKLAAQMSISLGHEWLFQALDNGSFLKDIDAMVKITNGLALYNGSAHAYSMLKNINFDNYGILHSGQVGDVVISSFLKNNIKTDNIKIKSSSCKLIHKVDDDFKRFGGNEEIANLYIRAFNGALAGNFVSQQYTETISPFLDVDFLNFCLSIPVEKRVLHKIYKRWIISKYPKAANFKWETINAKITDPTVVIRGKIIPIKQLPKFFVEGIMFNLGFSINGVNSKKHMNPFAYWYKTNDDLRLHFDEYYYENLDLLSDSEIKNDCESLYKNGTVSEKMQVLSLLSAVKQLGC